MGNPRQNGRASVTPDFTKQCSTNLGNDAYWDKMPDDRINDALEALKQIDADLMTYARTIRDGPPRPRLNIADQRKVVATRLQQVKNRRAGLITENSDEDLLAGVLRVHGALSRYLRIDKAIHDHYQATLEGDYEPEPHDLALWRVAGLDMSVFDHDDQDAA